MFLSFFTAAAFPQKTTPVIAAQDDSTPLIVGIVLAVLTLVLVWVWQKYLKRKRLIENVPTSKVKGIFMGLNEVKGQANCDRPLSAYLCEKDCIWYKYSIEEYYERTRQVTDKDGKTRTERDTGWETVDSGSNSCFFYLQDDTGHVLVRPEKAEFTGNLIMSEEYHRGSGLLRAGIEALGDLFSSKDNDEADTHQNQRENTFISSKIPVGHVRGGTGRFRLTEYIIAPGDTLYVMASARPREDIIEPELAYSKDDDLFIISVKEEESILRRLFWITLGSSLGGLIALVGSVHLIIQHVSSQPPKPWVHVLTVVGYIFLGAVGYLILMYNGLVDVRNRMKRSWSLIDIQLKRRADLIPRLAECVKGFTRHENEVQTALAEMRSTGAITTPTGAPTNEEIQAGAQTTMAQGRAMTQLIAVVEAYPDLKSNELYQNLHTNLVDTEDRVALARRFFNDSVTAYNNRIETLPDVILAKIARFSSANLYEIQASDRANVSISMDS